MTIEEQEMTGRAVEALEGIDEKLEQLLRLLQRADDRASGKKYYSDDKTRI